MPTMLIVAIPTAVVESVRATMRAPDYGHPAHTEVATGHGPCRHCLRTFAVGAERRILFTYDRFAGIESLPLPGPIYVHAEACERYPEGAGFPDDLRPHSLTLDAYARGRRLVTQEYVTDGNVEKVIEKLLEQLEVDYIQVCDTEAGCYDFRIERQDRRLAGAPAAAQGTLHTSPIERSKPVRLSRGAGIPCKG